ncbi:MAG: signal peptide peptidase SppA [Phycisphaerae bacterium]
MMLKKVTWMVMAALTPWAMTAPAAGQFDVLKQMAKGAAGAKKIAYFKIKGALPETPTNMPPLFGSEPPTALKDLLDRFKEARHDDNVVAVVVDLQQAALGLAQLQELHESLRKFAAVDKDVYVHADTLTTGTYAIATGATHISLVPTGDLWLTGLYGETPYLRGALNKLGCIPDFEHCGDYKTGPEPLTREGPSDRSKEMTKRLLDRVYDTIVQVIAKSRGISAEKVKRLIDNGPYSAEEALEAGLIDAVQHRQDFTAALKRRYGKGTKVVADYAKRKPFDIPEDPWAIIPWLMQLMNPTPKVYTTPSVAIVYVEGTIQTGSGESSPFGPAEGAFSTTLRKALDKAARDKSVKAVVLRINSPGGSALASEIILNATRRVAEKKPLIVSMGTVAASGGYYVTCASDTIFADSGTITASIGVFGGKLVTTGMWDKLGVNWHAVQRGKMAGLLSSASTFNDEERAKIRHYMNAVYDTFRGHVQKARDDRLTKPLDDIAGGRVFTGAEALELGLIDKIGGLEDAVKFAAQRAELGEYDIRVIPEPASIFDLFMGDRKKDDEFAAASGGTLRTTLHLTTALARGPGSRIQLTTLPLFQSMLQTISALDPLRAAAVLRSLQRIELVHNEGVVMMMPQELLIR